MSKPCACVSTFVRVCGGVSRSLGRARRRRGLRRPARPTGRLREPAQGAGAGSPLPRRVCVKTGLVWLSVRGALCATQKLRIEKSFAAGSRGNYVPRRLPYARIPT